MLALSTPTLLPVALSLLHATTTAALVLPRGDCDQYLEFDGLQQTTWFYGPPQVAIDWSCTSVIGGSCILERGYAHTTSVEKTISGGVSFGLDIGKIFSLGAEAGFAYTWGTSDETSMSSQIECPEGGITCALQMTERLVNITGRARLPPGGLGCPGDNDWHDFHITAPLKDKNVGPTVNFIACLESCGGSDFPESCDVAYPVDNGGKPIMPLCATKVVREGVCEGNFGGECGFIPIDQAGK